jgi:hypothetical protein
MMMNSVTLEVLVLVHESYVVLIHQYVLDELPNAKQNKHNHVHPVVHTDDVVMVLSIWMDWMGS